MKYLAHIFDVDDNGAIITSTETVHKFSSETDDSAVLIDYCLDTKRYPFKLRCGHGTSLLPIFPYDNIIPSEQVFVKRNFEVFC